MLKKLFKVLGIFLLTVVGLLGISAIHFAEIHQRVPVNLLGDGTVSVNSWDNGFVDARGTWVIDGERSAAPLNTSEINCFRDKQRCYVAYSEVSKGGWLNAELGLFDIKRWDNSTLEYGGEALCATSTYVIDRATQKLVGRRLKKRIPNFRVVISSALI